LRDVTTAAIPNRPIFRAQEVCEIAQVQSYVLRSWEAEFPELGVSKVADGPRVYRRRDVERVLRIKHLLFVDGLTLAGARKRLGAEGPGPAPEVVNDADVAAMMDEEARQGLRDVRRGLQWILGVLAGDGTTPEDFVLLAAPRAPATRGRRRKPARPLRPARPARPARAPKKVAKRKKR
jgi:DNA-binding transcriptional MerR regulator